MGHFTFQCQFLVKIPTLGPEKWVKSDKMHPPWANNIPNYYMARNSQAKWRTVISWYRAGFYNTDHYHGNGPFPYFFSPGKFKLSETTKALKKRNLFDM